MMTKADMSATDTPTDQQIQETIDRGFVVHEKLWKILANEDDPGGVLHALWITLTRDLAQYGWTAEELSEEAAWHAAHETSEGVA
jgi:hypothetical protein